jgi:hypothetical protein
MHIAAILLSQILKMIEKLIVKRIPEKNVPNIVTITTWRITRLEISVGKK